MKYGSVRRISGDYIAESSICMCRILAAIDPVGLALFGKPQITRDVGPMQFLIGQL